MPPREASRVIAHLDECAACFAAFRGLYPALANPKTELDLDALLPLDEEPFHLDFAGHLRPFVDGETDEIINEIVTGHIAVCPSCGQELRDLQEFRDSLRWQQAAQAAPGPWARLSGWWQAHVGAVSVKSWAWAFGLLLACGVGMWLVWRGRTSPPAEIARQTETALTPTPFSQSTPTPNPVKEKPTPGPTPAPAAGDEPPPGVAMEVAQAIRAQKLTFPATLHGLGALAAQTGDPRGSGPATQPPTPAPAPQAPLGIVREARPVLSWAGAEGKMEYQVTITDAQNNVIATSPKLNQTNWRPAQTLPPGRLRWQVKAIVPTGSNIAGPNVLIYRLSLTEEARLQGIERATTSALARGVAYAQAGLLTEAAQALRQWLAQHPDSETARKLLSQVEARKNQI